MLSELSVRAQRGVISLKFQPPANRSFWRGSFIRFMAVTSLLNSRLFKQRCGCFSASPKGRKEKQ